MENKMKQKIKILLGATGIEILFRLRCTKAGIIRDYPSAVSCQSVNSDKKVRIKKNVPAFFVVFSEKIKLLVD
jgi:hypothetical protein